MDSFIFIAAFLFGVEVGLGSAALTWGVYGFVNPYGQDNLILLFFLMIGESFYAVAGALLSRTSLVQDLVQNSHRYRRACLILGLLGFQATFAYDLLTNFASWLFMTTSLYQALITGVVFGAPFAVLHEASNLVFFPTVVPLSIAAAKRLGLAQEISV